MEYIFIHGLGQTEKSWDNVVLNCTSKKVYCPNLQHLLNKKECTYENLYSKFTKYLDGFGDKINLCGLSLGAVLALNYAIDYPEKVNSLVLIAPQYKMPTLILKLQNIVFKLLPNTIFDNTGFTKSDFISLTSSMGEINLTNRLSEVTCETLIICGKSDYANKKASKKLEGYIKNAEFILIPNAKHEVNTDNPSELLKQISEFYKLDTGF